MRRQEHALPAQLAITVPRITLTGPDISPRTPRIGIPPRKPRIGIPPRNSRMGISTRIPRVVGTSEEVMNRATMIVRRRIPAAVNRAALFRGRPVTQSAIWDTGSAAGGVVVGSSPPDIGQMVVRAPPPDVSSLCRSSAPVAVVGGAEMFCSRCGLALTDTRDATPSGCLLVSTAFGAK